MSGCEVDCAADIELNAAMFRAKGNSMAEERDWRAPDAKPMTFDEMAARAQYEWDRAETAEAEAKSYAASLAAKDKEIERRDAFIKELSDALLTVRPLGGSELFVKRFGQHYADPAYCKAAIVERHEQYHNAMKGQVRERNRAEQAERALAEAVKVIDQLSSFQISETHARTGKLSDLCKAWVEHKKVARAFVAQHGSDSREGK